MGIVVMRRRKLLEIERGGKGAGRVHEVNLRSPRGYRKSRVDGWEESI